MGQMQRITGRNTVVYSENGTTYVKYHWTNVVAFNSDQIILNTNGWRTVTTKARMNQASNQFGLGYYVRQKDFDWFVEYKGETIPFTDSMVLIR